MAINEVCRLCLATDDLEWIFDKKSKVLNMKDVISITTGIEIHKKDVISQKICGKCYEFSIKIFQFRGKCFKADTYLKGLCRDYLVDKKFYIPNTEVSIKSVVKEELYEIKPVFIKRPSSYAVHPSVFKLSQTYPEMKLPRFCLSFDMSPVIEMELDQVENYYKRLNLDFRQCVNKSLMAAKKSIDSKKQKPSTPKIMSIGSKVDKVIRTNTFLDNKPEETVSFNEGNTMSCSNVLTKGSNIEKPQTSPIKSKNVDQKSDKGNAFLNKKRKLNNLENVHSLAETDAGEKSVRHDSGVPANKRRKLSHAKEKVLNTTTDVKCINFKSVTSNKNEETLLEVQSFSIDQINECGKANASKATLTNTKISLKDQLMEGSTGLKTTNKSEHAENSNVSINTDKKLLDSKYHTNSQINEEPTLTDVTSVMNPISENDNESLTSVGRSVPLYVCEICNSVHYNMYELKKHQNKHMRCQFCKIKFRKLDDKTYHIENMCTIKKIMNNSPYVELLKVEHDKKITGRYPEAFLTFRSSRGDDLPMDTTGLNPNSISFKKALFKDFPPERLDVIEILSDDDTLSLPVIEKEEPPIVPDITIRNNKVATNVGTNNTEKQVLKKLLTNCKQTEIDNEAQTSLPSKSDIEIKGDIAVLKNVLPYLSVYSIPVKLQTGEFNVSYDYANISERTKQVCSWHDLIAIDIKSKAGGQSSALHSFSGSQSIKS